MVVKVMEAFKKIVEDGEEGAKEFLMEEIDHKC